MFAIVIDMFSVVNVYLDHLKFCVVCINGRRYAFCHLILFIKKIFYLKNECLFDMILISY